MRKVTCETVTYVSIISPGRGRVSPNNNERMIRGGNPHEHKNPFAALADDARLVSIFDSQIPPRSSSPPIAATNESTSPTTVPGVRTPMPERKPEEFELYSTSPSPARSVASSEEAFRMESRYNGRTPRRRLCQSVRHLACERVHTIEMNESTEYSETTDRCISTATGAMEAGLGRRSSGRRMI